jgi:hypothetical protein
VCYWGPSLPHAWVVSWGVIAVMSASSAQRHLCCGGAPGCELCCSPAHRNIVGVLKIEREFKKIRRGTGRSPCWSPHPPSLLGLTDCHCHCCRHLGPALVVAVVPDVVVPRKPLVSSWSPFHAMHIVCL